MINLFWGTEAHEGHIGNLYGYRTHNMMLKKYTQLGGEINIVDSIDKADACLYITIPEVFEEKPDVPTFLFTMFEGLNIPDIYLANMAKADFLITPSTWVKNLFDKHFSPDKIFVVPHGVEEEFTYKKRDKHPKVFRYLWVGAANPRKGYQELIFIWDKLALAFNPKIELYIKTTRVPGVEIQQLRNVILDSRNLSKEELIELYHSAHCFVFPTRGEGFGLTLAEAMATGLPCISPLWSGVTEFFDGEVGFPTKYVIGKADLTSPMYGNMGKVDVGYPDVEDFTKKMAIVKDNYKHALKLGWKASVRIHSQFTWENSAKKLALSIKKALSKGV